MTARLLLLFMNIYINNSRFINFTSRCPSNTLERVYRSSVLFCSTQEYHCLYADRFSSAGECQNYRQLPQSFTIADRLPLAEVCHNYKQLPPGNFPRYSTPSNNIYYEPCAVGTYQLVPVKSFELTECMLRTSLCVSEGQIECTRGNTKTDSTCRCDYKNGYVMMHSECCSNSMYADCTCYKRNCPANQEMLPDYTCVDKCPLGYERKRGEFTCTENNLNSVRKTTGNETIGSAHYYDFNLIFVDDGTPYFISAAALAFIFFVGNCYILWTNPYVEKRQYGINTFFTLVIFGCCVLNILIDKKMIALNYRLVSLSIPLIAGIIGSCVGIYMLCEYEIVKSRITLDMKYHVQVYQLLDAAAEGDLDVIKRLRNEDYIDMFDTDYDQRTALHLAASKGRYNVVKYLLDHRAANINAVDRWNKTAKKDAERLKENLEKNKDVYEKIVQILQQDIPETDFFSYREEIANKLIHAAETGNLMKIKKFHALGTDMDLENLSGRTALQAAVDKEQEEVIKYLLDDCNVSPFVKWHSQRPTGPLLDAKRNACLKKDSFEKVTKDDFTKEEKTLQLLLSASRGDIRKIRGFFMAGFEMNLADYDKRTALHVAVSEHQEHIVQFLIQECKVDINLEDSWGWTALFEAQKNKKKDLIQLFRLHNKDLADTLSSECETFKVLRAGSRGEKETLESLHKDGFDMEVRDYDGRTALHLASMNGHKDAVNFLINSCKVTTNIPDRNGRTPYEEAKEQYGAIKNNNKDNNYFSILRLFEEQMSVKVIDQSKSVEVMINDQSKDVEPIYVINKAVAKGNLAKLKSLGLVYMDAVDYLKETPLHIAAAKGQLEVVKYLVEEKKVSLFVRNSFWQTPIHLARKKCKYWQKKITRNPSEKPASKWDDYGRDFQSDSDSEDGKKEEKDKDIHDRIKLFKEVSEYLRRKMRDQVDDDENVDTSLSKYREDELTFLFLNSTFRGDIAAVKRYLATKGHNLVNEPDYSQRTALHIAVSEGHYHLVIYFLKNWKANTDCKDRWGHKPIDDAKRNKDEKMIEIIEKYSNYNG